MREEKLVSAFATAASERTDMAPTLVSFVIWCHWLFVVCNGKSDDMGKLLSLGPHPQKDCNR